MSSRVVSSLKIENRSLTVAAQNEDFRAARVSERYAGQHTRLLDAAESAAAAPPVWPSVRAEALLHKPGRVEENAVERRLAELEQGVEARLRQSYESGFHDGQSAAMAEANAQLERLARSIGELVEARARMLQQAESDVVRLSVEIARRILHREMTIDPDALEGLVRVALERLQNQEIHRVRVHPDHEGAVRRSLAQCPGGAGITVVSDAALRRGDALFEIATGILDASIDVQLGEIERGLADRFQPSPVSA